jgi:hypothetical protein
MVAHCRCSGSGGMVAQGIWWLIVDVVAQGIWWIRGFGGSGDLVAQGIWGSEDLAARMRCNG